MESNQNLGHCLHSRRLVLRKPQQAIPVVVRVSVLNRKPRQSARGKQVARGLNEAVADEP
jgi:hypothetical protein